MNKNPTREFYVFSTKDDLSGADGYLETVLADNHNEALERYLGQYGPDEDFDSVNFVIVSKLDCAIFNTHNGIVIAEGPKDNDEA